LRKNELPTGRINVYGVHKKADVSLLDKPERTLEELYREHDGDFIDLVLFVLGRLHHINEIDNFEIVVAYSYFTTNLVHKTIAERISIDDGVKGVRYMSKQNVHQNIIRKVIDKILEYVEKYMPQEFQLYFPNAARGKRIETVEEELEIYDLEETPSGILVSGELPEAA